MSSTEAEYRVVVLGDPSEVGAVRCSRNANYGVIRKEIETDELVEFPFEFVTKHGNTVRTRQEEKWLVEDTEVHIKRKLPSSQHASNKRHARDAGYASQNFPVSGDVELQDVENDGLTDEGEKSTVIGSKQESKLLPANVLKTWQSEVLRVARKLQEMGRQDEFELYTNDADGKPLVKLWCKECGDTYGSGATTTAHDTLNNFLRSHIHTTSHLKGYIANHGDFEVVSDRFNESCCKEELEAALSELSNVNSSVLGASFEVIEATVRNAQNLYAVRMRCTLDEKWMPLVPKRKSTKAIILEHLKSKGHIMACVKAKHELPEDLSLLQQQANNEQEAFTTMSTGESNSDEE